MLGAALQSVHIKGRLPGQDSRSATTIGRFAPVRFASARARKPSFQKRFHICSGVAGNAGRRSLVRLMTLEMK